jgi:hypothetical protein
VTSDAFPLSADPTAGQFSSYHGCEFRVPFKFTSPLTLEEIRAIPRLDDWGALRGNFQRNAYAISDDQWARLIRALTRRNPRFAAALQRVGAPPRRDSERQIETRLSNNLAALARFGYRGARLFVDDATGDTGRQLRCDGWGRIDLLCEYGRPRRLLVIEIKNTKATRLTLAQALGYQQWVSDNIVGGESVQVLVVSRGAGPDFTSAAERIGSVRQVDIDALFPRKPRR